jgi:hypothetical protein
MYPANEVRSLAKHAQQQFVELAKQKLHTEQETHGLRTSIPFAVFLRYATHGTPKTSDTQGQEPPKPVLSISDALPLCEVIDAHVNTERNTNQLRDKQDNIGICYQAASSKKLPSTVHGVWIWDKKAVRISLV